MFLFRHIAARSPRILYAALACRARRIRVGQIGEAAHLAVLAVQVALSLLLGTYLFSSGNLHAI